MATVVGTRATAGTGNSTAPITSNQRVIDMSDTIHLLDPNEAPLTALTMKLRTVTAINPKVEWMEDDYVPTTSAASTTATSVSTAVSVTTGHGTYFRANDLVKVLATGETLFVSSVTGDVLTVGTRGSYGATANAQIDNGAVLLIIGNAQGENSGKRNILSTDKTPLYNVTQIFRDEFGASGTLEASELYGGSDLDYQRKKKGKEFRIMLERSYLFGERGDTPDTPPRIAGGVIERITTNVQTGTATLTMALMETWLATAMRYGPARKMLFASRDLVSYLSLIAGAKLQTRPTDQSFPLALTEWVSPHGKIYIATHNLLTGTAGTTKNYGSWGLLIDLDSVFHRPLKGRNTMLRTNIQAPDVDGRIDGYLAECCVQLIQEKNHAIINSITTTG